MVANINLDLIEGLDFIKAHNCMLDATKNDLTILGKPCKLISSGSVGCYHCTW